MKNQNKHRFIGLLSNVDYYGRMWSKTCMISIANTGAVNVYCSEIMGGWKYDSASHFFRNWTIIERRVLIEKTGYCV